MTAELWTSFHSRVLDYLQSVTVADLVAQHLIPGSVPVGVVTVVIGGLYLIALLIQEAHQQL